jgi:hypothetical protein
MSERQTYRTLESAFEMFPWWPQANLDFIHEKLAEVELTVTEYYTPPKQSYIGLRVEGANTIVSLHFGYIAGLRDENGKKYWIDNPINKLRDGDGPQNASRETDPCPTCGVLLPLTGHCDECYG